MLSTVFILKDNLKILPYYSQLSKIRVPLNKDLQPKEQKGADFVGSKSCKKCHKKEYNSMHPKMIQDPKKVPHVVVGDFSTLPSDADFTLKDVVYTIGGKFKQRYMIRKDINSSEDYILGNYQYNCETKKRQKFKPWKYWYKEFYPHDNHQLPTSKVCDGCHFVGFMSKQKRVEMGISCESCHGPASKHIKDSSFPLYVATRYDSVRANEICFQCHMRNRDKRLNTDSNKSLKNIAVDYPLGYEAGRSLDKYKLKAPFTLGDDTKEFWANGSAKKNRTQANACFACHKDRGLDRLQKDLESWGMVGWDNK